MLVGSWVAWSMREGHGIQVVRCASGGRCWLRPCTVMRCFRDRRIVDWRGTLRPRRARLGDVIPCRHISKSWLECATVEVCSVWVKMRGYKTKCRACPPSTAESAQDVSEVLSDEARSGADTSTAGLCLCARSETRGNINGGQ